MFNITSIFKVATGFLGGIKTYLIVGAVSGAVAFGGGIWLETKIAHGEINAIKLADAKYLNEQIVAVANEQLRQNQIDLNAAISAQKAFDDQHLHFVTITKEIPAHVTPHQDAIVCIPVGLARSLRAEADGSDIDALQLAPGQSDDDCSDVTASEVADWFKAYAEAANHNAAQLNLLIANIKEKDARP